MFHPCPPQPALSDFAITRNRDIQSHATSSHTRSLTHLRISGSLNEEELHRLGQKGEGLDYHKACHKEVDLTCTLACLSDVADPDERCCSEDAEQDHEDQWVCRLALPRAQQFIAIVRNWNDSD